MYERVIRPTLFRLDAERAHNAALRALRLAGPVLARVRPLQQLHAALRAR